MYRALFFVLIACFISGCQPPAEREIPVDDTVSDTSESAAISTQDESGPAVEENQWQLEGLLTNEGEMGSPLAETTIDINFSGGKFSGSAGCNRYFGSYAIDPENGLTVSSEVGSTQMACTPPVDAQEHLYLSLLGRVAGWNIDAGALIVSDENGQTLLEFRQAELPTLEGVVWQATGINNGEGGVVSWAGTEMANAIFADGTVSGSGGCNHFNASYETDGERISIGSAMSTRKACAEPEGIMDQEQQYFQALERSKTFQLRPGRLELRDDNGSLQVGFKVQQQ